MAAKKLLHILLFMALMTLKVSAAPIYLHECQEDGQIDDCELCEHAIHNQHIAFATPPQFQGIEIDSIPTLYQHKKNYESVAILTGVIPLHFGRPPPHFLRVY
jgi:hypothetical protein